MQLMAFSFNKIYVIESLKEDERLTGTELYNDIIKRRCEDYNTRCKDKNNIESSLESVQSLNDWNRIIAQIQEEVEKDRVTPILHLELHGSKDRDGLILANGALIPWEKFVSDMRRINIGTENNLFITMGICFGLNVVLHTLFGKPAPFWGIIGSFHIVKAEDIYIRYQEFYNEFLDSFDLSESLKLLYMANPERPEVYSFINSQALFNKVAEKYRSTRLSDEAIESRARGDIQKIEIEDKLKLSPGKKERLTFERISLLKKKSESYLTKYREQFLMMDLFDSCRDRFQDQGNIPLNIITDFEGSKRLK